jgi:hypothetical protein
MNALQVVSRQRGEGKRERLQVHPVACPAAPLRNLALQACGETTLELPFASAGPSGELEPPRELSQELEQRQVGPDESTSARRARRDAQTPRRP